MTPSAGASDPSTGPSQAPALPPLEWRRNLVLFLATVASVFGTGFLAETGSQAAPSVAAFHAAQFTAALLSILLAHEFGHFIAARLHHVDASLPFFIPMPVLSPFGTMGAVIRMRGLITTRKALLDIGAAGPLAGLVLAVPLYVWGVHHSRVVAPTFVEGGVSLGESLLMRVIHHWAAPVVPEGMDLELSPVALAAWGGLFVTMINLLPLGQLDGGHVAFALLGPRQNDVAKVVHRALLAFFFVSLASYVARDVRAGLGLVRLGRHLQNSMFWLIWFEVLAVLGTVANGGPRSAGAPGLTIRTRLFSTLSLAGLAYWAHERPSTFTFVGFFAGLALLLTMEVRFGTLRAHTLLDHPPTGATPLGAGRKAIAIFTLALFAALFMPTPFEI